MIKHLALFLALAFVAGSVQAQPPTDASIEQLLYETHAESMMSSVQAQTRTMMQTMIQKMSDKQLTPKQQAVIDNFIEKYTAAMADYMTWDRFKSLYMSVYRETFTQEELNGILEFYQSPAGQSFIAKMPTLMSKIMQQMPDLMAPMMEKAKQMGKDLDREMKAASN